MKMRNVVAFVTLVDGKPTCHLIQGFKIKKGNFLIKISDSEALNLGPLEEWHRQGGFLLREQGDVTRSIIEFVSLSRDPRMAYYSLSEEKAKAEDVLAQCYLRYQ